MKLKMYQIDAFAEKVFTGNPAAVCILDDWLSDELMLQIAAENNLSETAFAVPKDDLYEIRWFTPVREVKLCGHATLATAFVIFNYLNHSSDILQLHSPQSGSLSVAKSENGLLTLNFPADTFKKVDAYPELNEAIGKTPLETYKGKTDYLLIYENQADIESIQANFHQLMSVDARGVIVTAKGNEVDFVSRFFAPTCGVDEDPVTGSAHTSLTPFWSKRLGKKMLSAKQISVRGGNLQCEYLGDRVKIFGRAVPYLIGEIDVPVEADKTNDYPVQFVTPITLEDDTLIQLRPIHPVDGAQAHDFESKLSTASIYNRFLGYIPEISNELIKRFTQIDYSNEMAIVAETVNAEKEIIAIARIAKDDAQSAEFAIIITDNWHGKGLGTIMTDYMIKVANDMGFSKMNAHVFANNTKMLEILRQRKFELEKVDSNTVNAVLKL